MDCYSRFASRPYGSRVGPRVEQRRARVEHSFLTGLPALEKMAREDDAYNLDTRATEELARRVVEARKLLQLKPQGASVNETID